MTDNKELTWLEKTCRSLQRSMIEKRLGHALLIVGPPGVGKRSLASWICERYLHGADRPGLPTHPLHRFLHPDATWLVMEEGKTRIAIEQVRSLIADLNLKSHAGGGKAAVIESANSMTLSAANSLLKTLEEPPGDTLLILVADSLLGIPPTVLSRCSLIRVAIPTAEQSEEWLPRRDPGADWAAILHAAGGAPIGALRLAEEGGDTLPSSFAGDLEQVVAGDLNPLDAAARWKKAGCRFALVWLERVVQDLIRHRLAASRMPATLSLLGSVLQHMDSRELFCYLDRLTALRNQPDRSFNEQLALEALLIPWRNGLGRKPDDKDGTSGERARRAVG